MSFVMSLDIETFVQLVFKAFEKEAEEKIWQKWLVELPYMDEKNFMTFERYKDKHFKQIETEKTDEEILHDAENILKLASGK